MTWFGSKCCVRKGFVSILELLIWCRDDKLLVVMTLLKLDLVKRKVLLFVNSIEAGFRLRLFLESFGLRSASINAELPLNSRHHILQVDH